MLKQILLLALLCAVCCLPSQNVRAEEPAPVVQPTAIPAYQPTPAAENPEASSERIDASQKAADSTSLDEQNVRGPLELALKTISLSQGEGGAELWRLKAEWANMRKEDGKIVVEKPKLTYFMEDGNPLLVTSSSGIIDQKAQILRFISEVHISQKSKVIRGDLLVYNGTAKMMTFPQGGVFLGDGVSGRASFLSWNLNLHTIAAEGGVSVFFAGPDTPTPLALPE